MRPGRTWQLWAITLAGAFLLGLSLPHHHEDHEEEGHQDCTVCKLQEAAGSSWCRVAAPVVVRMTVAFLVEPTPDSVLLPPRLNPNAPRAPPVA